MVIQPVTLLPIEFHVSGRPASLQGSARRRDAWKDKVRAACATAWRTSATHARVCVTIYYFPKSRMSGDIDNMVKPIIDAMSAHVYHDDEQVDRIEVQRFQESDHDVLVPASIPLSDAMADAAPAVYVRVGDDPLEEARR